MSQKIKVESTRAPAAIGPYSQAVIMDGWLYCSGQIALDPVSGTMETGGVEAEARRVFENLAAVLKEAGSSFGQVVKVGVYLKDLEDFDVVNRVYAEYFEAPYPARACVEVARLPRDALVELDCVARTG